MGYSSVALYDAVSRDVSDWSCSAFSLRDSSDLSYKQFASSYLLSSIIKKLIPKDTREADAAALAAFTSANNRCRTWQFLPQFEADSMIFGEIRKVLDDFLHPGGETLVQSLFDLLRFGRPGPGAAVGSFGTSYYTKYFASKLACTSLDLYNVYRDYCAWIPFLSDAECQRYDQIGGPTVVSGSRCSFVPKTSAVSRMICVEPSLNMYIQLGLAHLLEERLKSFFGIDLKTQPQLNHKLAREGSIDGSFATIDLSSASDSISIRLCEMLFPKWFFELLLLLRSRTTEIDGNPVPLFMISTMGNGFTFPLQTIIFAAVLRVAASFQTKSEEREVSCFGDDLICHKSIFYRVKRILEQLGFSVNEKKTFFEGGFRESCGADWFFGRPVRPVFIRKLDSPFDLFVAINQLNEWSAYTGIPLRNTLSFLLSQLTPKFLTYVPFDSSLDSGIRVPLTFVNRRYDKNLSFLFRSWERSKSVISIYEGEIRLPGRLKNRKLLYNPSGLYCSFLFGELVGLYISVRQTSRKIYKSRLRCCPYWDYIPTGSLSNGHKLSWQQWETAVSINLDKPL